MRTQSIASPTPATHSRDTSFKRSGLGRWATLVLLAAIGMSMQCRSGSHLPAAVTQAKPTASDSAEVTAETQTDKEPASGEADPVAPTQALGTSLLSEVAGTPAPSMNTAGSQLDRNELDRLAQQDPVAFLRKCLDSYACWVKDYRCTFIKQESIDTEMTPEQEMRVAYREYPRSVDVEWVRNPGQASRAMWVQDKWKDANGIDQVWVKPAGALIRMVVPKLTQPIRGMRAKSASRRHIDDFGFRRTLELIVQFCEKAQQEGVLGLKLIGEDSYAGRPTYLFERRLPFNGDEAYYPDGLLRFHIDKEWLVPTACYSYADVDGQKLLGLYLTQNVSFNIGLSDADFDPHASSF